MKIDFNKPVLDLKNEEIKNVGMAELVTNIIGALTTKDLKTMQKQAGWLKELLADGTLELDKAGVTDFKEVIVASEQPLFIKAQIFDTVDGNKESDNK